jgi:mRNA interferase HigB
VISRKAVHVFGAAHPNSVPSLSDWPAITRKASWRTFADLRVDFGNADLVGRRTVFNISGNKYRMIARVNYQKQRVYILHIMKHTDYAKGEWK